jgi:hypothetical protein
MLLTSMDIDAAYEADFNHWYDREHLIERVAIDGFLEARRYVAHEASPKYLALYSTKTFEVLESDAYRHALANQTDWSKINIARFRHMIRGVARITASRGQGRGAVLGLLRLRPEPLTGEALRAGLLAQFTPETLDGIVSMHLLENDPALSRPLTVDPAAPNAGDADWFVLIDGTSVDAVRRAMADRFDAAIRVAGATRVGAGIYTLLWDLARADLAG